MLQWVRVNSRLEPDPSVDRFFISHRMSDANQPRQMTLKDYMNPTRSTQPSCITLPTLMKNFEIKSSMIQMLPTFQEPIRARTDMLRNLRTFVEPWNIIKWLRNLKILVCCRLTWKIKLSLGYFLRTVTTWIDLAEAFYKKFYSKQKTTSVRQTLNTFHQLQGETFFI